MAGPASRPASPFPSPAPSTTETGGMRRQDLEAEWWNLPGYLGRRYTKTGRDHRVPLVPLWSEYVLPRVEGVTAGKPHVFASDHLPDRPLSPQSIRQFRRPTHAGPLAIRGACRRERLPSQG
jgi:hypothetical protein